MSVEPTTLDPALTAFVRECGQDGAEVFRDPDGDGEMILLRLADGQALKTRASGLELATGERACRSAKLQALMRRLGVA